MVNPDGMAWDARTGVGFGASTVKSPTAATIPTRRAATWRGAHGAEVQRSSRRSPARTRIANCHPGGHAVVDFTGQIDEAGPLSMLRVLRRQAENRERWSEPLDPATV